MWFSWIWASDLEIADLEVMNQVLVLLGRTGKSSPRASHEASWSIPPKSHNMRWPVHTHTHTLRGAKNIMHPSPVAKREYVFPKNSSFVSTCLAVLRYVFPEELRCYTQKCIFLRFWPWNAHFTWWTHMLTRFSSWSPLQTDGNGGGAIAP